MNEGDIDQDRPPASGGPEAPLAPRSVRSALRGRLPEILIEASFIFLAVLLALFADEYRERRDRQELADRALSGIIAEIRANREELTANAEKNQMRLDSLRDVIEQLEGGAKLENMAINYDVALTSTAAWDAARMSQAVHFMSLDVVTDLAEMYELQALFERTQDELVDSMVTIGTQADDDPLAAAREAYGRISSALGYRGILVQVYDGMLDGLGGEDEF